MARPDGTVASDPGEMAALLWESRASVWGKRWEHSGAASLLLAASSPQALDGTQLLWPDEDLIARLALGAAGAAPGADGIP